MSEMLRKSFIHRRDSPFDPGEMGRVGEEEEGVTDLLACQTRVAGRDLRPRYVRNAAEIVRASRGLTVLPGGDGGVQEVALLARWTGSSGPDHLDWPKAQCMAMQNPGVIALDGLTLHLAAGSAVLAVAVALNALWVHMDNVT